MECVAERAADLEAANARVAELEAELERTEETLSEEMGFKEDLRERAERAETAVREMDALWSSADNAALVRDLKARAEKAEREVRAATALLGEWLTAFERDEVAALPVRATRLWLGLPAAACARCHGVRWVRAGLTVTWTPCPECVIKPEEPKP